MTDDARDVARILDQLADRVDRLESGRSQGNEVATTERVFDAVECSDSIEEQYQEPEPATWNNARLNVDTYQ